MAGVGAPEVLSVHAEFKRLANESEKRQREEVLSPQDSPHLATPATRHRHSPPRTTDHAHPSTLLHLSPG